MDAITLCYHDIVHGGELDASGFRGASAGTYKLEEDHFRKHIEAIVPVVKSNSPDAGSKYSVRLTFDDGGASSCRIADILEHHGFRGYFFVPTDYIGRPAFLNASQILDLQRRGHIIGSHSCSHRGRMSSMSRERLIQEWMGSVRLLSDLLGEHVTVASVPSGYYHSRVAETAASAGVRLLFTLEPTSRTEVVEGCTVAGRYLIRRYTSAEDVAVIAAGAFLPRLRQQIQWNAKKVLKAAPFYTDLRRLYFEARSKVLRNQSHLPLKS